MAQKIVKLQIGDDKDHVHKLGLRSCADQKAPESREQLKTVVVENVPPYVGEQQLLKAFSCVGTVNSVKFCRKLNEELELDYEESKFFRCPSVVENKFKKALIVFQLASSVKAALALDRLTVTDLVVGMEKWTSDYFAQVPNTNELKSDIDLFMRTFDAKSELEKLQARNEVDSEGWTTITKKSKRPGFQQRESVINKIEEKLEKSKKRKELTDFYTFQFRESKMKHIVGLRKRYAEDKKRIEEMKQKRRFKPF